MPSTPPQKPDPQRVRTLFEAWVDLEPAEQSRQLRALKETEPALAARVGVLLAQDSQPSALDQSGPQLGASLQALLLEQTPTHIQRFKVLEELGRGAMGVVYRASQDLPTREVALKTLPPWNRSAPAKEQFRSEIQALARVLHPGIPQIYEVFEHQGAPVIAMELVHGQAITQALATASTAEKLGALIQVCEAAHHAHQRGVIHRDLKPNNILMTPQGQAKVLDFGVAALIGEPSRRAGTLAYMAPEQRAGAPADVRGDVYSIAVLAQELLETSDPLPRPLKAVLEKGRSPAPKDRYPSALALGEDLQRTLDSRPVLALAGDRQAWIYAHLRRLRSRLILAAAAAVLAGLGAALFQGWRSERAERARHREAAQALVELQSLSEQAPSALTEGAFLRFSRDPTLRGSPALSQGWLWWASQDPSNARSHLVTAWLTAPDPTTERAALEALAMLLHREQRWEALSEVLSRLPEQDHRLLRLQHALWRGDTERALALATPSERAPITLLTQSRTLELLPHRALPLPDGSTMVQDGERIALLDPSGQLSRQWPRTGGLNLVAVEGERAWLTSNEGALTVSSAPVDALEQRTTVEVIAGLVGGWALADLDQDGAMERYGLGRSPNSVYRAEPDTAQSTRHPQAASPNAMPQSLSVTRADQTALVAISNYGWRDQDLRVLRIQGDTLSVDARLRMGAFSSAFLHTAQGTQLFVLGMPNGVYPGSPKEEKEHVLVQATWRPGTLTVDAVHDLPVPRLRTLFSGDINGDGREDLVATGAQNTVLMYQEADGGFSSFTLPGLEVLALGQADGDPAMELWVRSETYAGVVGVADGDPIPQRPGRPPVQSAQAPEGSSPWTQELWQRAQVLAELDLAEDAAASLLTLAQRSDPVGIAARVRAMELMQGQGEAVALARTLAQEHWEGLPPSARQLTLEQLRQAHDFELLETLGEGDGPIGPNTQVFSPQALHPSLEIHQAHSLRSALGDRSLILDALSSPEPLMRLATDWSGAPFSVHLDLDLIEHDWANSLSLELRQGDWLGHARLARQGGGDPARHHLSLICGQGGHGMTKTLAQFEPGPNWIRLSYSPARAELRCEGPNGATTVTLPAPLDTQQPIELSLSVLGSEQNTGRTQAKLSGLRLQGLTPSPSSQQDQTKWGYVSGDLDAARRLIQEGAPLDRVVASSGLAPVSSADLRALTQSERAFLLRTAPLLWGGPMRAALPSEAFADCWLQAWSIPIFYRTPAGRSAVLNPALKDLPLSSPSAATLALFRAEALMDSARTREASLLLDQLSAQSEDLDIASQALLHQAHLAALGGDPARAKALLTESVVLAPDPFIAQDRAADIPVLAALMDPESKTERVGAAP